MVIIKCYKENKEMKKHLFTILVQLVVSIIIVLYFVLIPVFAERVYWKGANYDKETYTIQDITKDTVR